jgi:sugar/nucleoside kinase (ribokinase family)
MKKVICIGSATKDMFVTIDKAAIIDNSQDVTAKKLMAFEYGAKIYADEFIEEVGGSAVNLAVGLTKGGYRCFVLARTARNDVGKWIEKKISKFKIKKNYMQQNGGVQSEAAVIIVDKRTIEHVILRTGDSVNQFNVSKALKNFREKVDWIYVGSLKENWQEKLTEIIAFAKKKKARVAFNPSSFQISNDSKKLKEYLVEIDLLLMNRDEAIEMIKNIDKKVEDQPNVLLARLGNFCPGAVVLTDGAEGAYAQDISGCYALAPQTLEKVDSVGAGDAFASGFLSAYIENGDVQEALCWGIVNSGSVIGKIGATAGLLARKELKKQSKALAGKVKKVK